MRVDPDEYMCGPHDVDLTRDVISELEETQVASYGVTFAGLGRGDQGCAFNVVVTCPGTGATGDHQLLFSGRYYE